ncbi:MAG: chaperonin GroL [Candidatus Levybacteria bacterium RIFCSPHIGHO2_01_FULL_37_17]|nr:MAG: chaperonin GroL [Candidatus Levybacteria bacterium RIFCSPHIGHO2_01_FULL_37_17]OGH37009.1 MAG: chaperonin GroL [Candidatus Levybacteria bacterium RIFCSPLOWO2_01_FULL_38_23]
MAKKILYAQEARQKLQSGVDQLAKAVATTLGPKGRNVALDKKWGSPNVIHDGVTVAKEIELKDPFENMGAQLVKEAASKTNDVAGDGTTTATVLAQAIVDEGLKNITAGANPMLLKKGLEEASRAVVDFIKSKAKTINIKNNAEISQIATISAGDEEIGTLVAEALQKVGGKDGVVSVEEGRGLTTEKEYKEGMEFDKGYASAYFVTNADRMTAEIEEPYILITDKKVSNLQELLPFLENLVKVSKNLVIIADDIDGEALALLVVNKLKGAFNSLAVKAPGFGDRRKEMLEDIAILTGATVISEDTGRKFDSVTIEDCGRADKVWSDKDNTRIIGGKGSKQAIEARISQIRREMEITTSDFDKEKLQERLAKLTGGVAVINVGAATEVEMKEKKERVIDAVAATKSALEEGIVPGGGVILLESIKVLDPKLLKHIPGDSDQATGVNILRKALEFPTRKLAENAGVNGDVVIDNINKNEAGFGYDVLTGSYVNMIERGIIDPAKVTRSAVENAVSVASMILTTESLITDEPEEKKETPGMPPGGMDY